MNKILKIKSFVLLAVILAFLVIGIELGRNITHYYTNDWIEEMNLLISDMGGYTSETTKINDSLNEAIILIGSLGNPVCIRNLECIQDVIERGGNLDGEIKVRQEILQKLGKSIQERSKKLWPNANIKSSPEEAKIQNMSGSKESPTQPKDEQTNPLGFITGVKTTQGTIYLRIDQESVYFRPFDDMDTKYKSIHIKKEAYPKLFKQGIANFSSLQAEEYIDPQTKEIFIKLSNNQPDHAAFASTYVLLVNPFTGEIKEGKTKLK